MPLVILGAGFAGYAVLRALRRRDRDCAVTIVTADDGAAYAKAHLPRALAEGRSPRELVLATAEQLAHRYRAQILTGRRVRRIDRVARELVVSDERIPYGRLVLSTGSVPLRQPAMRGSAAARLLTLGDLGDYAYVRSELAGRNHVAVLGGGIAGCEIAESLARRGCDVTLFEPGSGLLPGVLPGLAAARVKRALQAVGVQVRIEDGVQRLDHGVGELALTTLSGASVPADLVICARGRRPRAELAREAGLVVGRGVVVDARLVTTDPDVFALGACAEIGGRPFLLHEDTEAAACVLADVLGGGPARLRREPRLRSMQFEGLPVVLCEPPPLPGEWHERATARGVRALFHDAGGALRGFALLGDCADEAERLLPQLPRY